MIAGRATVDGTRRRAGNRPGYRMLGSTGLTVSLVGFGGYRTGRIERSHRQALRAALEAGVNLVDTSSNYMFGDSERLVGEVLAEGRIPRDELVIVSKVGYVQGPNLQLAHEREAAGRAFPEMVKYADGVWHCIAPEFLEDQVGRSLERLQLETVDVLLLHNPEYFLSEAAHHPGQRLEELRAAFYDRLSRAFAYLDGEVTNGRVGAYGVSSNTCVAPADDVEATSVTRMHEASGGRMSVLQLPYNLLEVGALLERNTPEGTALDAARARNLGVLVNRPLNAMAPGRHGVVRLADPPTQDAESALRERVELLAHAETELGASFGTAPPGTASLLIERWEDTRDPRSWARFFDSELVPEAKRAARTLLGAHGGHPNPEQQRQLAAYQEAVNALVERLHARAARPGSGPAKAIRAALEPVLAAALRHESLSRLAIHFAASTPGVTCVLNGMRDPAYVADAVGAMALPPIPDVVAVARAVA